MQNEELHRAQNQAETVLEKYTDLFDFAPVGYFMLAGDGTILGANLTGARLLGFERARLLSRRFTMLVSAADRPAFNTFLERTFAGKGRECCEVALLQDGKVPIFVRIEAVASNDLRECRAAVLDITAHHQTEAERERLIGELQTALDRVKMLSGMLPICSGCKKIRDDKGYWNQVESYIQQHSEATFTHGLCPDCIKRYSSDEAEGAPKL